MSSTLALYRNGKGITQKILAWIVAFSMVLGGTGLSPLVAYATGDGSQKVKICHIPQGNPDNMQTIEVDRNSVTYQAHISHGDTEGECQTKVAIVATKVVCDEESKLPNWASLQGGGPNITANTASDYVASHPGCRLEPNWKFQWGFGSKNGETGVTNGFLGAFLGEADGSVGLGSQTGTAYSNWKTFGPTNGSGVASVSISNLSNSTRIWVREVLKDGYVSFSNYSGNATNTNNVSAEIYCHNDVLNYDNYDFISNPTLGSTYHCVAFNALKNVPPPPPMTPPYCGDGLVNQAWEECDGGLSCTLQCQTADQACTTDIFAKVNISAVSNKSLGNMTDDVYLGSASAKIPEGTWFPLRYNGVWNIDASIDGYENVPGLAVARDNGGIRIRMFGSHVDSSEEHVEGNIEFINGTPTGISNDAGQNKLEGWANGLKKILASEDEAWITGVVSNFWMTVTTADDGYRTSVYGVVNSCEPTPMNEKPVITVTEPNPTEVAQGSTFVDLGATASDPEDGNITPAIVATGSVDTGTVGEYTITYNVVDSKGLAADSKTRTVKVVARPAVCAEPSVSGDTVVNTPKASAEKTVKQIMEDAGITIDHSVAGREYQTWSLSKDITDVEVTYLGGIAGSKRAFGFYKDSNVSSFTGVFKVNEHSAFPSLQMLGQGDTASVSVAKGMTGKLGFALDVELSGRKVYATENALNHDSADHVLVYEIAPGDYVLAFEDLAIPGADEDFNDLVVRVKVTGCRDITVTYQCSDGTDNDSDSKTDFPEDLGCENGEDNDENDRPTITLLGDILMSISINTSYADAGANANDAEDCVGKTQEECNTALTLAATGSVNTAVLGSYTVTYNAVDSKGLTADPKTRTVTVTSECYDGVNNDNDQVFDYPNDLGCTTPEDNDENDRPVIALTGANPLELFENAPFNEPGFVADDAEDGVITDDVVIGGNVDTSLVGTYTLTYNVVDSEGLAAVEKTRTVKINPALTECADDIDNDGDQTADHDGAIIEGDMALVPDPGCTGPEDNDENERPVITLRDTDPLEIHIGSSYTDPLADVDDPEEGEIDGNLVLGGDAVDTNVVGTYVVRYNAADSKGLAAVEKTRTVKVVSACSDGRDNDNDGTTDLNDEGCDNPGDDSENQKPVITLLGEVVMSLTQGSTFTDPGATAADTEDGDITVDIVEGGVVDTATVGSYTLTYDVSDSEGLAADQVTRTVNVAPGSTPPCSGNCGGTTPPACADGGDNDGDGFADYPRDPGCSSSIDDDETDRGPELTLLGGNPLVVEQGTPFTDPGATAQDPEEGDITSRIVVTGSVNTATLGTYTLTYNVSDAQGQAATPKTRTVNVTTGGGGGGGTPTLTIFNEKLESKSATSVLITWNTNLPSDSRVVYGLSPVTTIQGAPLFGYELTTATDATLTTFHSMTIEAIPESASAYFRPISKTTNEERIGVELVRGGVLGESTSCEFLKEYMRYGQENNPVEVTKLQSFLRAFEGELTLEVNSVFDQATDRAVRRFQDKYKSEVLDPWALPTNTGYVYYTTQKKINEIYCARQFPLNNAQVSEIADFRTLMLSVAERGVSGSNDSIDRVNDSQTGIGSVTESGSVAGANTVNGSAEVLSVTNGMSGATEVAPGEQTERIKISDLIEAAKNAKTVMTEDASGNDIEVSLDDVENTGEIASAVTNDGTKKNVIAAVVSGIYDGTTLSEGGAFALLIACAALLLGLYFARKSTLQTEEVSE
jgi:hypothetical protein